MRSFPALPKLLAAALAVAASTVIASPLFAVEPVPTALPASRTAKLQIPRTFDLGRPPIDEDLAAETQEWRYLRALMGPGDLRRLDAVYVRFNLMSQFVSDPELDPFYDRTRETVRAGYMKMYREILQRQYPIDELVDDALAAHAARRGHLAGDDTHSDGPSWRLKVAPRVAVGSNGYLGVRMSLPNTGIARLDHLQLNMRHGVFEPEWAVGLRYANGPRFLQLERVAGDETSGERYTLTVALRF
ncbi:MAG TPA: hypothetical protein VGS57_03275 [Thermoanaerobaculia bacterium]|jgi:hypothetical protein|nr:hypothetical protein [Thermoanaerobaculia bacterium]